MSVVTSRKVVAPLWAILTLALLLRVAWALCVPVLPLSDSAMYDGFARGIAAGEGYRLPSGELTAYWPVGTAALYAVAYRLFGSGGAVVAAVNAALGVALVASTYSLARRHFGTRVAAWAGMAAAIWPMWIEFTTILSSELPFTLALVLALLARGDERRPLWLRSSSSTALLVLASFFRPTLLPLAFVFPMLDFLRLRAPRQLVADLVIATLTVVILVAPWAMRNGQAVGAPVPISTNFGINLWLGNHDGADGRFQTPPAARPAEGEVAQDAAYRKAAITWIVANPASYMKLVLKRSVETFSRETMGVYWNERGIPARWFTPIKLATTFYWWAVFGLSLVGVLLFLRGRMIHLFDPLIVVPAAVAAGSLLIMASDRFHMPMMPFVATFAGVAIVHLADRRLRASRD